MLTWRWLPFADLSVADLYALLALRQEVFVVEQACAYLDADGRDPAAHHLLGHRDGALVAYLRAFPPGTHGADAVIGRVVTAPAARGQGLGRPLVREGLRRVAATWAPAPVYAGCQAHLDGFYRSLGFEVCGPGYDEDGIPHLPMRHPGAGHLGDVA